MRQPVIGFWRHPWRVRVIGQQLDKDDPRAKEIASEWLRWWRALQRWKRGECDLEMADPAMGGIVRARRGEAMFVEVQIGEEAQPIPTISTAAELGTATLAQWEDVIWRYGLPAMGPDAYTASRTVRRFGETSLSGWDVRARRGEPVLLRVRLRDLQVFGHRAALLFHSVNASCGQTFPLRNVLRCVPQDVVNRYLGESRVFPSKEEELWEFAYQMVETTRRDALAELHLQNFTAADAGKPGPVWDFCAPGWWEFMVLTTLQGLKYREPRWCVNRCGRLVPMGREKFCSDDCEVKYVGRMKKRRQRAKGKTGTS